MSEQSPPMSDPFWSQLSHSLCHDIRSHAGRIQSFSGFLREDLDGALSVETDRHLSRIEDAAQALLDLVKGLQSVTTELEAPAEAQAVTLAPVAEDIFAAALARHGMSGTLSVSGCENIFGRCDHMKKLLGVLFDNSVKFSAPSQAVIQLHADQTADGYMLLISDQGPGIPARHAERIFDPFTKASEAGGKPNPGLGLGLTLAKRIAALNAGAISIDQGANGAHFRVMLKTPSEA